MKQSRTRVRTWISMLVAVVISATHFHSRLWAQDGFGNSGPPKMVNVPISVDDDLSVVIPVAINLPPDPGPAGDVTIQGIDADGDGVRDDIEREIFFVYPDNAKARSVLYQMAKYYQSVIVNRTSASTVLDNFGYLSALEPCLEAATGDLAAGGNLLRPQLLNTYDRSVAYITALKTIKGMEAPVKIVTCP